MSSRPSAEPPLVELRRAEPLRPLVAAGPRATAVVGGGGDLSVPIDTRGSPIDWGGVYGEGIRFLSGWSVRVVDGEREWGLPETLASLTAHRYGVASVHVAGELTLQQTITPLETGAALPTLGRRIEIVSSDPTPRAVRVETTFSPYLAPVLLEGIKPYVYEAATHAEQLRIGSHGYGLALASDPLPSHLALDRASWIGGRRTGELREVLLDYDLRLAPNGRQTVAWILSGGFERDLGGATAAIPAAFARTEGWLDRSAAEFESWIALTPSMELPGLPAIETAYRLARGALRQLYHLAEPELTGLVAGVPWYSAIWGRDLGWMLPAVTWLGDREWAERSLRCLFRYQAKTHLPLLGAAAGEIPMQLSGGPLFLYGTSDSSLYFPTVLQQLIESGASPELRAECAPG
ncbi:MAG TPA: hypothetical protein VML53_01170, partial [Thermoplasmata archaeon]|nr:hypothetical protein [Thermoplasmata archaeon]